VSFSAEVQWLVLAVLLAQPSVAWAYIDPGSGIVFWQSLIAAVGAALVFMRKPLAALKRLLNRLRRR
jgi:hypothetical protein